MAENEVKRLTYELELSGQLVTFRLEPIHTKKKFNYQIYSYVDGKEIRFHMQLIGNEFQITDKHRLPDHYLIIEQALSQAIIDS